MVQADLGQEPLEPQPAFGRLSAAALVLVDDQDPLLRPAQRDRPLGQGILKLRGLAIPRDLLRRRLADVDDRQAFPVAGPDLPRSRGGCAARAAGPCGGESPNGGTGGGISGALTGHPLPSRGPLELLGHNPTECA